MHDYRRLPGRGKLWALAGAIVIVAASGGALAVGIKAARSDVTAAKPIKIGVLTICGGAFAPFQAASFAGAKYPLVARGGKLQGTSVTSGVSGVKVGGHPIQLSFGCSDATPDKAVSEARRLVEQVGVDILLGPLSGDEGIAIANYAKKQPSKTFVNGSSAAQETTLKVHAPNFFRYGGDGAQWMAGLGTYAYKTLRWRKAAILGEDYSYPWTQAAGFVAEFCAHGGNVTKRIWGPIGTTDWASYVARIPRDVDGFLLLTGGTDTVAIVKAYAQFGGDVSKKMLGGSSTMDPTSFVLGDQLAGVAGSVPVPLGGTTAVWRGWEKSFSKAFPKAPADSVFSVNYANSMDAILRGLTKVNGDISDRQVKFRSVLAKLTLKTPNGPIKLDKNRNSIQSVFIVKIVKQGGKLRFRTLKTIPNVSQTFGGLFGPKSPPPGRESPKCKRGPLPPWAK